MKLREAALSHEELTRLLDYNPETGVFRWKVRTSNRVKAGDVCRDKDGKGAGIISVNGIRYLAHRLAWFYFYKVWPEQEIDHINRAPDDNRIANLREANRTQNNCNRSNFNLTGFKGVTRHKAYLGKFLSQIQFDKKHYYLGIFDTIEDANAAYVEASFKLHGEWGRID